jgi:regulator of protease activity HflC (stomatin/prohibitin superfamily)
MNATAILIIVLVFFTFIVALSSIKMVSQATVKIIERLGKYHKTAISGLNIIVPFIDSVRATLDLREQLTDIEPQPVITRDNVTMEVDCIVYWQIIDPVKAVYEISTLQRGIQQLTLSALRAVIGEMDLDHTLAGRETINTKLRASLDVATDKWGVKVMRIELRNILPPEDIRLTMEKQMTAERNRRATILQAEGQAEARLRVANAEAQAITVVSESLKTQAGDPATYLIAMRYLESLKDISANAQKLVFLPYETSGIMGSLGGIKEMLTSLGTK